MNILVMPMVAGPLFRKLLQVTMSKEWSFGIIGVLKAACLLATVAPPLVFVKCCYDKFVNKRHGEGLPLAAIVALGSLATLRDLFKQSPVKTQILETSWNLWFSGLAFFISMFLFLGSVEAPVVELLLVRRFRSRDPCPGTRMYVKGEFVTELSEKYPEWQVQDHAAFWQNVNGPGDLEGIRSSLLEQDLPHVEHASMILRGRYRHLEQSED